MKMKIHNKGQVVIPSEIRKKFDLEVGDQMDVVVDDNGVHLYPVIDDSIQLEGVIKEEAEKYGFPDKREIEEASEKGFAGNESD